MTTLTTYPLGAHVGRKKQNFQRDRLELRADRDWVARVFRQADRLGISLAAYIRAAVTRQIESDESNDPGKKPKQPGR